MKHSAIVVSIILIDIFFSSATFAQVQKEWDKVFEDANIYLEIGDYVSALDKYERLFKYDSSNSQLNFNMGVSYFNLNQPEVAFKFFKKALKKSVKESFYYLGKIYHLREEFDQAIVHYQQYLIETKPPKEKLNEVNKLIEISNQAKTLKSRPVNVDIINLGEKINSTAHDYAPLVYGPETELYFTSRREGSTGGEKDPYGRYFEDIYVSRKEHGEWQAPIQLGPYINTPTNDASVGISADGQILYFFRTNEDLVSGDLYESMAATSGWGEPRKLSSQINSEYVESSASLSNDERALYFSSDRPGGYGGKDIYRVVKLPTGNWSLAQNLGPVINTEFDEDAPFIHADNKTLYFSSNGHKTMGGYDIFESTLNENGTWSIPLNMGYPVNSVQNDFNFVMSPDKQNGYYSSAQEGGYGGQDIYVINFKLFAEVLSVVKGGVFSKLGASIPIGAKITLIDSDSRNVQGIYKTNDETGKFIMVVTPEKEYTMVVEADGYHTYSKQVSFTAESLFSKTISEINLVPTEVAGFE